MSNSLKKSSEGRSLIPSEHCNQCELLAVLDLRITLRLQGCFFSENLTRISYVPSVCVSFNELTPFFSIKICYTETFATSSVSPGCQPIMSYANNKKKGGVSKTESNLRNTILNTGTLACSKGQILQEASKIPSGSFLQLSLSSGGISGYYSMLVY